MGEPQIPKDEVARRGKDLYQSTIRAQVERDENIGKLVSLDIESGDYEVGDDLLQTARALLARRPGTTLWGERIGYKAVYGFGASNTRTGP